MIVSQQDENRSKADGIQLEPAHNGKVSMRTSSSNAISIFQAIIMLTYKRKQKTFVITTLYLLTKGLC